VVLYGCEILFLILRAEPRPSVIENRVLRRIFGSKRDEVTEGWIKLHNEELHNSYSSRSIIRKTNSRMVRWTGHVAQIGRRGMDIGFWWERKKEGH
jgi:hypothetical protein